jgi:4-hydroxy-2-oxoheptanedioate aldolase
MEGESMIRVNSVKERLKRGESVFGCVVGPYPYTAEVVAGAGFDFIQADGEHYPLTPALLENVVRAGDAAGTVTFTRLASHDQRVIIPFLDTGVLGLQVAHCTTAQDAEQVVAAAKYAPIGNRGVSGGRVRDYGAISQDQHIQEWNEQMLAMAMVEDREAVDHLPAILEVPGLDVIAIGLGDLSASLGHPGEREHPEVWTTVVQMVKQIRDAGCWCAVAGVANPGRYADIGVQIFKVAATSLLRDRAVEVVESSWASVGRTS